MIERGPADWGAYVLDLPGCTAVGETKKEVLELIQEAIEFHLDGLREDGESLPEPHSEVGYVEMSAV